MPTARLLGVTALVALAAPVALAATATAPLRVSVTVVRSCTVSSEGPEVTVECGRRAAEARVTRAEPAGGDAARTAGTRSVTIEF